MDHHEIGTDVHVPLRMIWNNVGDHLTFQLAPSTGQIFVKYLAAKQRAHQRWFGTTFLKLQVCILAIAILVFWSQK